MKIRSVLFVLLAACGSETASPTVATQEPIPWVPPPAPVVEKPAPIEAPQKIQPPAIAEQPALPSTYRDAMSEGKELATKGDQMRARELFEAAAKLDKKRAEPYIELARSYIAGDDRGKAIQAANKAVKLAPESTTAWNTLGRAELARKGYDAAITAFNQAVELDRDNVWAWNNLGFAELTLKHYDKAVDALVQATSRPNAAGYMFNNLGTAYVEQLMIGLDEAREAFDKGGTLGSVEAKSSRKRLEGVKTLAVLKPLAPEADEPAVQETTPEVQKADEPKVDVKVESVEAVDAGVEATGSGSGSGGEHPTL